MTANIVGYLYVLAAVLFVLSLKWMGEVKTSRRGNWAGSLGMLIAVIATMIAYKPSISILSSSPSQSALSSASPSPSSCR